MKNMEAVEATQGGYISSGKRHLNAASLARIQWW